MTQRQRFIRRLDLSVPILRGKGGLLGQLRYPSNRQALVAVIASATLFVALVILWLSVSTRTTLLSRQLDENDSHLEQIRYETSVLWKQIGDATSPQAMDRRMRDAGYRKPDRLEFLVSTTTLSNTQPSSIVSPTLSLPGGSR